MNAISHILKKTLFLAKQLDDFEGFMTPGDDYEIIACRASESLVEKYTDVIVFELISGERTYSTQSVFRKILRNLPEYAKSGYYDYIWTYQAYPWTRDFEYSGIQVFCIDYLLFLKLQNKLNQRKLLLERASMSTNGSRILYNNLTKTNKILKTQVIPRFQMSYEQMYDCFKGDFVICDSYSDGGEGLYKITSKNQYLNAMSRVQSPVVRTELFLENAVPVNQIAFITSSGDVIKYKPSVQILQSVHQINKMEYVGCDFSSELHLPNGKKSIHEITRITHEVGVILFDIGYRGAFGCDYLIKDNDVHLIEINPRYQASTFILTRANGNHPLLAPHVLHILGFVSIPEEYESELRILSKADRYIDLSESTTVKGFLKVFDEEVPNIHKPQFGVKVETDIEKGYLLFNETIISSSYYPTSLTFS